MKTIQPFVIAAVAILSNLACAVRPAPEPIALAPRAEIEVTSSPNSAILVYADAPSRFALSGEALRVRSDTIRVTTPARLEAYLDAGEIHFVANGLTPLNVAATFANAPATHSGATGRHIVLYSGGTGIGSQR
jgi:hypothetical protein